MTDESNVGWWLWLVLLVSINAIWISMDVWLATHHHETLSREIHEALAEGSWRGLTVAAFTGATFAVILFHFFWQR